VSPGRRWKATAVRPPFAAITHWPHPPCHQRRRSGLVLSAFLVPGPRLAVSPQAPGFVVAWRQIPPSAGVRQPAAQDRPAVAPIAPCAPEPQPNRIPIATPRRRLGSASIGAQRHSSCPPLRLPDRRPRGCWGPRRRLPHAPLASELALLRVPRRSEATPRHSFLRPASPDPGFYPGPLQSRLARLGWPRWESRRAIGSAPEVGVRPNDWSPPKPGPLRR